jgi:hypothetical protein
MVLVLALGIGLDPDPKLQTWTGISKLFRNTDADVNTLKKFLAQLSSAISFTGHFCA